MEAEPTLFDPPAPPRVRHWPAALPRLLEPRLMAWIDRWESHSLVEVMRIETSARMRSSLGRAYLERRLIRLNHLLLEPGREELLEEVFCHEVAHLVVFERHGHAAAPHGREWRSLLREVGARVRVTIPRDECRFLPLEQPRRRRRRRVRRPQVMHQGLVGGMLEALRRLHGRLM
ncbi:MAG: SprT-like domain-containing protein [Phycisphaeraceae bacterium]|nr:SprT-like domain-containing protein [Phycisphaeraceae bacterium]